MAERSKRMAAIKGRDTQCEMQLARLLRAEKICYRRSINKLPGTPDFLLLGVPVVVFVDGDFWHGRNFKSWKKRLPPYWLEKISRNRQRDRSIGIKLRKLGYRVVRIWETDLRRKPLGAIKKVRSKM